MVEAGCWMGGSTAKFSIAWQTLGCNLWIYDSFEGVEQMTEEEVGGSYDFSGDYAASQEAVERNVSQLGEPSVCQFFKGWFRDTLARTSPPGRVCVAYIDCDLAKGNAEALAGILPVRCKKDGVVFSQDYHIVPVQLLLNNPQCWSRLGVRMPQLRRLGERLVSLTFP